MPHTLKTSTEFPAARSSPEQRAQDAFMDMHDGKGAHALLWGIETIASVGTFLGHLLASVATLLSRTQASLARKQGKSTK
ncbi:hypothetical protein VWZ88_13410 [Phaeobacter sp. JH20_36]|uniref:hypothetical protein n=1 Tax=Phaeobacter TaxID=302485 RepID=UPI0030C8F4D3